MYDVQTFKFTNLGLKFTKLTFTFLPTSSEKAYSHKAQHKLGTFHVTECKNFTVGFSGHFV